MDTVACKALALNVKSKFYLDQLSIRDYYFKKEIDYESCKFFKNTKITREKLPAC